MQLLILALVFGIFVHDAWASDAVRPDLPLGQLLAIVILPKLMLAAIYGFLAYRVRRRLGQGGTSLLVHRLERAGGVYQILVIALYALDLWAGTLVTIRQALGGNRVLVDDVLMLAPSLALFAWSWWMYYPIDRRLREATLIGRLDAGLPVYPVWTRRQYLLAQFRHQMALMLLPLLLLKGWQELVDHLAPDGDAAHQGYLNILLTLAGAGGVFLLAPVMLRHVWDTVPLPEGPLRQTLTALCHRYRVGVRQMLLWRTFGGMANAAVMGLLAPVRYILLTDALLEMMPADQVQAVMAHELAHIRKRHLFWLLAVGAASLGGLVLGWQFLVDAASAAPPPRLAAAHWLMDQLNDERVRDGLATTAGMVSWALAFGWISRRFERQADVFAVQHLSRCRAEQTDAAGPVRVNPAAVETMVLALQQVAELNHISPRRHSWRHGAIAWRQAYLRSLVGQRTDRLSIDRLILCLKLAAALFLVGLVTLLACGFRGIADGRFQIADFASEAEGHFFKSEICNLKSKIPNRDRMFASWAFPWTSSTLPPAPPSARSGVTVSGARASGAPIGRRASGAASSPPLSGTTPAPPS